MVQTPFNLTRKWLASTDNFYNLLFNSNSIDLVEDINLS